LVERVNRLSSTAQVNAILRISDALRAELVRSFVFFSVDLDSTAFDEGEEQHEERAVQEEVQRQGQPSTAEALRANGERQED
jgi:hypothetical protein